MEEGIENLLGFYDPYFWGEEKVKEKEKREGERKSRLYQKKKTRHGGPPYTAWAWKRQNPLFQTPPFSLQSQHRIKKRGGTFPSLFPLPSTTFTMPSTTSPSSAVTLLREATIHQHPIHYLDDQNQPVQTMSACTRLQFFPVQTILPRQTDTHIKKSAQDSNYTLDTLVFLVQHAALENSAYFKECREQHVDHVSIVDKRKIMDYLTGKLDTLPATVTGKYKRTSSSLLCLIFPFFSLSLSTCRQTNETRRRINEHDNGGEEAKDHTNRPEKRSCLNTNRQTYPRSGTGIGNTDFDSPRHQILRQTRRNGQGQSVPYYETPAPIDTTGNHTRTL
jgi:hypothetical protein